MSRLSQSTTQTTDIHHVYTKSKISQWIVHHPPKQPKSTMVDLSNIFGNPNPSIKRRLTMGLEGAAEESGALPFEADRVTRCQRDSDPLGEVPPYKWLYHGSEYPETSRVRTSMIEARQSWQKHKSKGTAYPTFFSFLFWEAKTQLNHWTKQMTRS